jgi:hypothetical protein
MRTQHLNFCRRQVAPFARCEVTQINRTFTHANKPQDIVTKYASDLPDLSFAAFSHHDANPCTLGCTFQDFNPRWHGHFAFEVDTFSPGA